MILIRYNENESSLIDGNEIEFKEEYICVMRGKKILSVVRKDCVESVTIIEEKPLMVHGCFETPNDKINWLKEWTKFELNK